MGQVENQLIQTGDATQFDKAIRKPTPFLSPPYEIMLRNDEDGRFHQEISFIGKGIPIRAEFHETETGELIEQMYVGTYSATVEFSDTGNAWIPRRLTIDKVGSIAHLDIPIENLNPENETTIANNQFTATLHVTHPDMNPGRMFGGQAKYTDLFAPRRSEDESWVVVLDGEGTGFTLPCALHKDGVHQAIEAGQPPVSYQLFTLPNDPEYLPETVTGFKSAIAPYVISNRFATEGNTPDVIDRASLEVSSRRYLMFAPQRSGHTKVVAGILQEAARRPDRYGTDDIAAYFIPTPDALARLDHNVNRYNVPSSWIHGYCYTPEPGYGGDRLPLDPTDPNSAKTMLTFLSLNATLLQDFIAHVHRAPIIYTDSKQDFVFLNMLAHTMDIPADVITKTYRFRDRYFDTSDSQRKSHGSRLDSMLSTVRERIHSMHRTLKTLGQQSFPDFFKFMHLKTMASFGSLSLYSTDGLNAEIPYRVGKRLPNGEIVGGTEIVPIPLVFADAKSDTENNYTRGESARARLAREIVRIQSLEDAAHHISPQLIDAIANPVKHPESAVVSLQFGTSNNLYLENAVQLIAEAARDPRMQNTLFLLTGFRQREEYLVEMRRALNIPVRVDIPHEVLSKAVKEGLQKKAAERLDRIPLSPDHHNVLNQIETNLPSNLLVMGMRRDIRKLGLATDVIITTASIGNITDAVQSGAGCILLGPDLIADDSSIERLVTTNGVERAKDDLNIMIETALERAGDCVMVGTAYQNAGLNPDSALLSLPTAPWFKPDTSDSTRRVPTTEDTINDIAYAITHREAMASALQSITFDTAEGLLDILEIVANGGKAEDVRQYIANRYPDFESLLQYNASIAPPADEYEERGKHHNGNYTITR